MKRREFLKSSLVLGAVAAAATTTPLRAAGEKNQPTRELYELRRYHLRRGPMTKRFDDFYRNATIPAMNRAGMNPVGVFTVAVGPDNPTMYVLITHKTAESLVTATDRLRADENYQKAGAEFINAPATDPSYVRVESSLMLAFEGMPKLEVPKPAGENKSRIFELRTYESHSKKANKKKIEMFNSGEIAIFRRAGVMPVFFGETLVGEQMPNLTYLVVFENGREREKAWGAFGSDPEWQKLKSQPGYGDADIVSSISNVLLRPTGYSQV
ncbi:MAG: NIPSNAP family containing protein [Verrucomicrobia bacterium]|nr:MAG: NIPSNAP family containing protein [Verrucomicrobiota bacterium]